MTVLLILLLLVAIAELAVSVMLLSVVFQQATQQETERLRAGQAVRDVQRQTIRSMFQAARPGDPIPPEPEP